MSEKVRYPLMFTFRDVISGEGFLAGVTISGRALMTKEKDDDKPWWMYGVRPGGIAETGATPGETFAHFRERYRAVLFDLAIEADSFVSFHREVEAFFHGHDAEEEKEWSEAFKLIRAGEVEPEHPFCELRRESPETRPTSVSVEELTVTKRFMATDNVPDIYSIAKAA